MTNYEEIKAKYANDVRGRRAEVSAATDKVKLLQAQIDLCTKERERCRRMGDNVSASEAEKWVDYTMRLQYLNKELEKAEADLHAAQLGEVGAAELDIIYDNIR